MRKGSYKLVKKKLLVKLLRSNFRFRSKISCSFNIKLCHLVFRILHTKFSGIRSVQFTCIIRITDVPV
jgi:hypothetical protein